MRGLSHLSSSTSATQDYTQLVRQLSTGLAGRLLQHVSLPQLQECLLDVVNLSAANNDVGPIDSEVRVVHRTRCSLLSLRASCGVSLL